MPARRPNLAEPIADSSGRVTRSWAAFFDDLQNGRLPEYKVADLPKGSRGQVAYAVDGRKSGESAGNGTGVLVVSDGNGVWKIVDYTNNTVTA